jgi:hypothetical protein
LSAPPDLPDEAPPNSTVVAAFLTQQADPQVIRMGAGTTVVTWAPPASP